MIPLYTLAQALLPGLFNIIDKAIPDKDTANKAKAELQSQMLSGQLEELKAARDIIMSEAQGESRLQRNWRPLLMLVVIIIIANNYILSPYLSAMFGWSVVLEIHERLWDLMTLGVGGYIGGRSAEKFAKEWNKPKLPDIELQSIKR